MSSMDRKPLKLFAAVTTALSSAMMASSTSLMAEPVDVAAGARVQMVAAQPKGALQTIDRWKMLRGSDMLPFSSYAGFLLAYPGFPQEESLRRQAEDALDRDAVRSEQMVAYFDRYQPITNSGRARYALALAGMGRPEAAEWAVKAWRGGMMSGPAEVYLTTMFGGRFTPEDQDARMDALLWQGQTDAAARQLQKISPAFRPIAAARLSLLGHEDEASTAVVTPPGAMNDAGYVYNLARYYRKNRRLPQAIQLLASRPGFASPAFDPEDFVSEALIVARSAGARPAQQIAAKVDDLFLPGADISSMSYRLRDDYTSLMWLGGTKALWQLGDGNAAAPLFYRYGAAARTPQTRSKGFYWAGLASAKAGDTQAANRYFEMAAEYPEYFYGQLSHERLGRALPAFAQEPGVQPTREQRVAFNDDPLVKAVRELPRGFSDWRTERYFFTALVDGADDATEMKLVADLAQEIRLPELAVVVGRTAPEKGFKGFERVGFPTVSTPAGVNWTMVHAIARQESEFDEDRVSHAGARGLMQLMPGTAREQAGKLGISYMSADLTRDEHYNIRLGDGYFERMLAYYGGSYPLAVAAYNAGPGNVNKWLRRNGDPRNGSIDWLQWIEEIPIFETKNYVQRVLENAVVYEQMHPDKVRFGGPRSISRLIGKRTPG